MNERVYEAVTGLDSLVREMQAGRFGHEGCEGWTLAGWPERELRCACGEALMAKCLRCGDMILTAPDGRIYSHDDSAMMTCAAENHEPYMLTPKDKRKHVRFGDPTKGEG